MEELNFEESMKKLEEIANELEKGNLSLDEVNEISSYKKDGVIEVNKSNFILYGSVNLGFQKLQNKIALFFNLFRIKTACYLKFVFSVRLILNKILVKNYVPNIFFIHFNSPLFNLKIFINRATSYCSSHVPVFVSV